MSKLHQERAELKEVGASKKQQKKYAPAVRRWNQKMLNEHQNRMNNAIANMVEVHAATKHMV